jgi:hypothetical protein
MLLIVLYVVFLSTCLAIIVLNDADILTFLAIHFGKAPGKLVAIPIKHYKLRVSNVT